ncbi:MAG: hypothetical protein Q7T66_16015 [Herminiimonas sp.]|uniref:hypothetical protein n=1 Tax=Herminiimonas sp. TaxID=1926289 RepID=UPI00271CF052|nr:hypothetical protein [Herminiimonas sp.]MDO9422167.1 hypothetical protein [Herminiimonas sp.]
MKKLAFLTPLFLLCLITGCTSKEQQAKYDKEKAECVSRLESFTHFGCKECNLNGGDPWKANSKADYLDAADALLVAQTTPAGSGYTCYAMKSRLNIVRHTIRTKEPSELRAEAEAANAAFDATQRAGSTEYEKKAVRHIRSVPGVGNRYDTYVMKDGTTHTCRTSITDAGRAVDCD